MRESRALGIGTAVAVVAALVVGVLLAAGGPGVGAGRKEALARTTAIAARAGCTMRTVPAERAGNHVSSLDARLAWSSYPPATGAHYHHPAELGSYAAPVEPRRAVHNLEHGAVVVWYRDISTAQRRALDAFYDQDPNGLLVTPIEARTAGITYPPHSPSIRGRIALTAWDADLGRGVLMTCPQVERTAFAAFRDAFRYHGPERPARGALRPGEG